MGTLFLGTDSSGGINLYVKLTLEKSISPEELNIEYMIRNLLIRLEIFQLNIHLPYTNNVLLSNNYVTCVLSKVTEKFQQYNGPRWLTSRIAAPVICLKKM
jgi:hypothetical protein